ncbi:pyridoxal-dependent decarboxylase, exosortase A system-associated [Oxalobacteraceae bacterium A2-2]
MSRPEHAPLPPFEIAAGCLQVGGLSLRRLAERVGRTPFYAYERRQVGQRIAALRAVLPAGVALSYAMKANPMPALVHFVAGQVDGMDVASTAELAIALDAGMAPQRISFAGPGKTDAELRRAIAAGALLHLESEQEMERAATGGQALGLRPQVAVRVNPDFELRHAGMRMGGGAHPFGVDEARVPAMLHRLAELDLDFHGFHIFAGSQNLSVDAIREAQAACVQLGLRLAVHAPSPLRMLNIGGGYGVPYFPGEQRLDPALLAAGLQHAVQQLRSEHGDAHLVLELGRYLVSEAGIYVCRVLERKHSRGRSYLVTDGGLHQHLAACGHFGQVLRKNYPVAIGTNMLGPSAGPVSVVGPLCTPLDVLADQVELPEAGPGDLVVVFQSGAYGRSASPLGFLSHPEPPEVLV